MSVRHGPQDRWAGNTLADFERGLADNLCYERGTTAESASAQDAYWTLAVTIRDRLADRRTRTAQANYEANPKFVYYLSAEYMLGRQLPQNAAYTGTADLAREAVAGSGVSAGDIEALDVEPGLGNGGLGRLAACLLDSLATLDMPAVGYGIRYEYGIFKQAFENGYQVEHPDDWAFYGNPWEFPAPDDRQVVGFYGHTEAVDDDQGGLRARWVPGETVLGEPSHMLVPGYGTETVNIIRLWQARAGRESLDLDLFNAGHYAEAVEARMRSENLTKVLYPSDSTPAGRELRLKQQYFLVSCSLRDIIRRFRFRNQDWEAFPDQVVIQLNDTHPVLAIPELMHLLVDENGVGWEQAWSITRRTFAYTCHTLLPEALETWPVEMFERLLPRHLEIIYALNQFFLEDVRARYPGDDERIARMSLIQEEPERRVRMANLAVVGTFAVNGVAGLQSRLLAQTTLRDFADLWPEKFLNQTNGVSPRRFLLLANPRLSGLITARLGDERWLTDLDRLSELEAFADDREVPGGVARGEAAEQARPRRPCARHHRRHHRSRLDFRRDGQAAARVQAPGSQTAAHRHPVQPDQGGSGRRPGALHGHLRREGGTELPRGQTRHQADQLGRSRGQRRPRRRRPDQGRLPPQLQRHDQRARGARRRYLGADLAGRQGGVRNRQHETGPQRGRHRRHPRRRQHRDPRPGRSRQLLPLRPHQPTRSPPSGNAAMTPAPITVTTPSFGPAVDALASGAFTGGDRDAVGPVIDSLLTWDEYMVLADYRPYIDCHDRAVGPAWADQERWTRMSILNTARSGFFSSDRTVRGYCRDIWHVEPVPVPPADLQVPRLAE